MNPLAVTDPRPALMLVPAAVVRLVLTARALAAGRSEVGVPARLAQPGASGPAGNQINNATGAPIEARAADPRTPMRSGQPALIRAHTATSTTSTQAAVNVSIQVVCGNFLHGQIVQRR